MQFARIHGYVMGIGEQFEFEKTGRIEPEPRTSQVLDHMATLDTEGLQALFQAANEYHAKYSRGPGATAMCVCGAGGGGSKACRGLGIIRDLFRNADFESTEWRKRFEFAQRVLG